MSPPADPRPPWLVVGVGPSAESHGALLWALREAERRNGRVLAVTVWSGGPEVARAAEEARLLERVRRAVEETGVHGRTLAELVAGPVAEVLTAFAAGSDVLVLGEHHSEPGPEAPSPP
ncbi:universal stress protein [Geodermatophilus sp. SYSU D00697]